MTSTPPATRRTLPWGMIVRLAGTLLTLGLLLLLLREQGWQEIADALREVGWGAACLALGLILLSRLATAARWHALLRGAGEAVSFRDSLSLTFVGLFASNFLPTTIGGDVVRLAGAFQLGLDKAVSTASLIVDRLVGMAGMSLPLPIGLALVWQRAGGLTLTGGWHAMGILGGSSAWLRKAGLALRRFARRIVEALGIWFRRPASLGLAFLATLGHTTFTFASIVVLLERLHEPLSFWTVAGLWSMVYFVTLMPFSVNGYGVQEVAFTFFFTRIGGTSMDTALALALILRTLTMIASLPGAFFVSGLLPRARSLAGAVPESVEIPAA
jgi:glycosyltransferase 2 family protein